MIVSWIYFVIYCTYKNKLILSIDTYLILTSYFRQIMNLVEKWSMVRELDFEDQNG